VAAQRLQQRHHRALNRRGDAGRHRLRAA
jgi:hypothetical protein